MLTSEPKTVSARWALINGTWSEGVRFAIDGGIITGVSIAGPSGAVRSGAGDAAYDHAVLVPAIHNAHSHAFQWAMRGESHALHPDRPEDDFWSWREHMYALASTITPERAYEIAREAYGTMRRAGYASVGEFHYLHHESPAASPPWEMALAHARAARDVGLAITLIPVAYNRGGFDKPADGAQLRFVHASVTAFLDSVSGLRDAAGSLGATVAVGVHSVRAVPADWLRPIARYAEANAIPCHIHVCEQRRELAECRAENGCAPIELLARNDALDERSVLVHATHLEADDISRIAAANAMVCACPSTERDLGDGLLEGLELLRAGVAVCVGSDSHAVVDAGEELSLLEGHERLRQERRNVLTSPSDGVLRPAQTLLRWGAECGARANGLASGRLVAGERFDALALSASTPVASEQDAWFVVERWLFNVPRNWPIAVYVGGEA
ncbi:MAG: formimidoylglutamate deiminase [Flavobacteriales bacterium]|jgi:formimidoylglutamate deiminase